MHRSLEGKKCAVHTIIMSYEVGTHIDFKKLNKTIEPIIEVDEKPTAFEIGTQFLFSVQNNKMVASRRIEVAFA